MPETLAPHKPEKLVNPEFSGKPEIQGGATEHCAGHIPEPVGHCSVSENV
jgi:hypothetical protein